MIRIVGVQKSDQLGQEFMLLQNQGSMRVGLKGHIVMANEVLTCSAGAAAMHVFVDDIDVMPGQYVLLRSCPGSARWTVTKEGQRVHNSYMDRLNPVWARFEGPFHILAPQHTYCDKFSEAILV